MYKLRLFVFILSFIVCISSSSAQVDFEFSCLSTIQNDCNGKYSLDLKDLDNDGDLDILSTSYCGETIVWNENIDGLGEYGESIIIDEIEGGSYFAEGVDLDNDGDFDILASLQYGMLIAGEIVWFENLNGNGDFSEKKIIQTTQYGVRKILARDVDKDGDLDIIYNQPDQGQECFVLLNTGGSYDIIQLSDSDLGSFDIIFEDIDNDGLKDIVSNGKKEVTVFKNKGTGEFEGPQTIFQTDFGIAIKAYDFDNDSDLDLAISSFYGNVTILENEGGMNFNVGSVLDLPTGVFSDVIGVNINNDEFIDLCVSTDGGMIAIINSGSISDFSKDAIVFESQDFTPYKMSVSDINLDSKEDVVGCSIGGNKLGIYINNTLPTFINTLETERPRAYVSGNQLHISTNSNFKKYRIISSNGQLIQESNYKEDIDISTLLNGIYFIQLLDENQSVTSQFHIIR